MRVALDHPNWDLSGYRDAESDYWVDEAAKEALVDTPPATTQEELRGTKDASADDPAV